MLQRKAVRRVRSRRAWAVRFLLIALAVFLFLKVVQVHGQIREKQQAIVTLNKEIREQTAENEGYMDKSQDSLENEAYANDYLFPGQQVYQSEGG